MKLISPRFTPTLLTGREDAIISWLLIVGVVVLVIAFSVVILPGIVVDLVLILTKGFVGVMDPKFVKRDNTFASTRNASSLFLLRFPRLAYCFFLPPAPSKLKGSPLAFRSNAFSSTLVLEETSALLVSLRMSLLPTKRPRIPLFFFFQVCLSMRWTPSPETEFCHCQDTFLRLVHHVGPSLHLNYNSCSQMHPI